MEHGAGMGFWPQEGKAGLLSCLPKAVHPLPTLPRVGRCSVPTPVSRSVSTTGQGPLRRRQAGRQPCREDGGFLRKRMQMREERELLIHVMSAELSMTN